MNFCCKHMEHFINDPKVPIEYRKIFREYYIKIPNLHNIVTISYCPWCSNRLPKDLREEYFDVLDSEYKLDLSISDIKDNNDIPEEFKSDEWWKKRGL